MQYLENYQTEFQQTFSIDAFLVKDEKSIFGAIGQGHSMTKGAVGGGVQSSL